jgi:hypothetical protein
VWRTGTGRTAARDGGQGGVNYFSSCPGQAPGMTTHDQPELLKHYSRVILSRSALPTTLTDDSAIAAAAMIGDSSNPKAG